MRRRNDGAGSLAGGTKGTRGRGATGCALVIAGCAAALTASPSWAQEVGSIVTDRPDRTESAESVPAGFVQVELGWTFVHESNVVESVDDHSVPEALVRIGLGGGVEARLGFGGFVFREASAPFEPGGDLAFSGAGDAEVGLKLEIARWAGGQIAFLGGASLPTGDDDFGSPRVDPSLRLLVAHELSDRLSLGYNVGVAWATETFATAIGADRGPAGAVSTSRVSPARATLSGRDTQLEAGYTVALGIGLTERVGAFIESFGAFALSDRRDGVHSLDGGFTLLLSDGVQIDLSAGAGLNDAADDWFIGSGLAVRIPR